MSLVQDSSEFRELRWPGAVDEIFGGDQVLGLAYVTPASGVVVMPVTNFAIRDPAAGTVTVNTSVGAWRKLDRMRRNPHVALAFHTREHSLSERTEYVLVQGMARISSAADPDAWLATLGDNWERFGGQPRELGRFWEWWLRAYHWRVNVEVKAERVTCWPDLACAGTPVVQGAPLPDPPPPQPEPKLGAAPRIRHARAARRAAALPNVLLGWVGSDGFPMVVPVEVEASEPGGIALRPPGGLVPGGGRRAGLTAHWFSRYTTGQIQRVHTGWLEAEPDARRVVYAPHTQAAYRIPDSRLAFNLGAGFATRRRVRGARRAGIV
jgi:nitroimidazol reductase NimA-like FMN-containing flavoprotein (pyridoxamine 5'-phosphate oxidase superfamily)